MQRGKPVATPASQVRRERAAWLWEERIPARGVTLILGQEGLGKSLLGCRLAAMNSSGELGVCGNTLFLTAEDSLAAVVKPRLEAAGADLDRVFFPDMRSDGIAEPLAFPEDVDALEELVQRTGANLVVIDPLVAYLNGVNSWQDQSVRRALAPLHRVTEEHESAVVAVIHLNKGFDTDPLRRAGGSVGLTAAARSVLLLAEDPGEPSGRDGPHRVLAHVKSNYGPLAPSLCLDVRAATIPATEEEPEVATAVLRLGDESDYSGPDLLAPREAPGARAVEEAESFLRDRLGQRAQLQEDLKAAAQEADLSWASVRRAKETLGVTSHKASGANGKWSWQLPDRSTSSQAANDEHVERFEHLHNNTQREGRIAAADQEDAQLSL